MSASNGDRLIARFVDYCQAGKQIPKAQMARTRLLDINPAVKVDPRVISFFD